MKIFPLYIVYRVMLCVYTESKLKEVLWDGSCVIIMNVPYSRSPGGGIKRDDAVHSLTHSAVAGKLRKQVERHA